MASPISESKVLPSYGGHLSRRPVSNAREIRGRLLLIICMLIFAWTTLRTRVSLLHSQKLPLSYRQGKITWTSCGENIECGRLEVPLDYFNASAGQASLAIARYPATNRTGRIGTLLTNPGGPGGSGVNYIYRAGKRISEVLDGRYDIVSWDPRGINGTTPRVECFASQTEQDIFFANTHEEILPDARNLTSEYDRVYFSAGLKLADARNAVYARLCHERSGEALKRVGTATVVRDIVRLYSELEGSDSPINFWGFSYGTVIGSYLVNMFPERAGRVVIDGVVNPDLWANTASYTWPKGIWCVYERAPEGFTTRIDDFMDTEKALQNFYSACAEAGKDRCFLASIGSTAGEISKAIDEFLGKLYERPLPVWNATRPGPLTASMVEEMLFTFMYRPREWQRLASNLAAALAGDGVPIVQHFLEKVELNTSVTAKTSAAIHAVTCVDTPPFPEDTDPLKLLDDIIYEMTVAQKHTSRHFGSLDLELCHHWRAREGERFTGPFNSTLKNKMLIIGNAADPITPVHNARAVNEMMPHSTRLVVQDGSGHCSSAMSSLCTSRVLRDYFIGGKLPVNNLACPTDEVLFPPTPANATDLDSPHLWLNVTSAAVLSAEDLRLIRNIRSLGKELELFVGDFKRPRRH